jgi:hypothetical protein
VFPSLNNEARDEAGAFEYLNWNYQLSLEPTDFESDAVATRRRYLGNPRVNGQKGNLGISGYRTVNSKPLAHRSVCPLRLWRSLSATLEIGQNVVTHLSVATTS